MTICFIPGLGFSLRITQNYATIRFTLSVALETKTVRMCTRYVGCERCPHRVLTTLHVVILLRSPRLLLCPIDNHALQSNQRALVHANKQKPAPPLVGCCHSCVKKYTSTTKTAAVATAGTAGDCPHNFL